MVGNQPSKLDFQAALGPSRCAHYTQGQCREPFHSCLLLISPPYYDLLGQEA